MAFDSFPLLYPIRLAEGLEQASPPHHAGANSFTSQLVQTMAATLNTPDTLPKLTEVLGTQMGAHACLLLRYHHQTQDIVYTCWRVDTPLLIWLLPNSQVSPKIVLQRRVVQSFLHPQLTLQDGRHNLSWQDGLAELLTDNDAPPNWLQSMQTCKTIPVESAPDIDGAILLLSRHTHYAPPLDPTQELDVVSLVAMALHQHYLQHQAQRSTEQLRYLNYLKEDFLSTLNHELRTPLTSMMLAIRMLRRGDLSAERTAMYLDILEQQCSREIDLVNDLLMLQTLDALQSCTTAVSVDLVQVLHHLAEQENGQFTAAQVDLRLELPDCHVSLATSSDYLTRVMQELLTNARKYAAPGSRVILRLEDRLADQQLVKIHLTNVGEGIQSDELPHIFDKFRRGQHATRKAIPGTGTGLALVKGLVAQLGGKVTVTSVPYDDEHWQTCFTLELLP
jgi:signal transduction histidine kinase